LRCSIADRAELAGIVLAVRWYLRFGLSHRDVEELLAERGIEVDHVTIHRWVRRFTPLLVDAARFGRHRIGNRWHVDETYVKVTGRWVYLHRAVDQFGRVCCIERSHVILTVRSSASAIERLAWTAPGSHRGRPVGSRAVSEQQDLL
jgi:transposase-like protein